MRRWGAVMAVVAAGCIALTGCDRGGAGHATEQAAAELAQIRDRDLPELAAQDVVEPEFIEMFQRTLDEFERTGSMQPKESDAGPGMLQLACFFKKAELARCLLLDGADANAHSGEGDSPLLLAVDTSILPDTPKETLIRLVDTLLAGGAEFARSGSREDDFLTEAAYACENEDVILYLMEKGAKPNEESGKPPALHGWPRVLSRLLENPEVSTEGLLHIAAEGSGLFPGDHVACLNILLRHGAKIADVRDDIPGTALFSLAKELTITGPDSPLIPQALDALEFLLHNGADPYSRVEDDEDFPGFCPCDLLAMEPQLMEKLRKRGIELQQPPLQFGEGVALLPDICRAAILPYSAEELAASFDAICAIFTPTPEMRAHETEMRAHKMYPQALEAAIALLARIDPTRASQKLLAIPLWQQSGFSEKDSQDILRPILSAVRDSTALSFPAPFLAQQAEKALQSGLREEAAELIELIARSDDSHDILLRYSEHPQLPLRAGAYAAQLAKAGLPEPRNNSVEAWLLTHGREADTPFLRDAVLITSLEKLWFGRMPAEEQTRFIALMRRLGAPHAADAYENIAKNLDNPEQLELLMDDDDWKFELEIATARFFLEHIHDFLSSPPQP